MIDALGRWGVPFMVEGPPDESSAAAGCRLPVEEFLSAPPADEPPMTIEVRIGEQPMLIEARDGALRTRPGTAERPDAVLSGPPQLVLGLLSGALDSEEAIDRGLRFEGAREALQRLQPSRAATG